MGDWRKKMEWLEMKLAGIGTDATGKNPILILRSLDEKTSVGLWIGFGEAVSLLPLVEGKTPPRPNVHQVFTQFIQRTNAKLVQVNITDMIDQIYCATLVLETPTGTVELDSRPSDAIALALRNEAPIYMSDKALEKSFTGESLPPMEDTSNEGKEMASYLHNLPIELFGKPV